MLRRVALVLNLFALTTSALSETYASKEWAWSTEDPEMYYAATVNEAGHGFGQYCYFKSGNCMYLLSMGTQCKEGNSYPALINSDKEAAHIQLVCMAKGEGGYIMMISAFDDIDRIVRNGTRVGIVIPLDGDQFKVSRFGLAGSTYAVDLMCAAAEKKMQRAPVNVNTPPEEFL